LTLVVRFFDDGRAIKRISLMKRRTAKSKTRAID